MHEYLRPFHPPASKKQGPSSRTAPEVFIKIYVVLISYIKLRTDKP